MKRLSELFAATCLFGLLCLPLAAAPAKPKADGEVPKAGLEFAKTASQITGIAISPLLGVSVVGAVQWSRAETAKQKAALPWFANPMFWLPCMLLVAACAFKDCFGTVIPPGLKKPFDALETVENKLTGLVAAGTVVPVLVNSASKYLAEGPPGAGLHWGGHLGGFAMIHFGAMDFSWLLDVLLVPLSVAVYAIVWMASHAINILILLSPWGVVDATLKAARTSLLGLLTITTWINPVAGVVVSLIIVIFAYFVAGWSFRLTVFGTVFCWDFFTRRRKRFQVQPDDNKVFTARKIAGVPVRTYGRLHPAADGGLVFKFKPWLVLPGREITLPREGLIVGRGVFYSGVLAPDIGSGGMQALLMLPPRYLGHEEAFARAYRIAGTREAGLRRAWSWLLEILGFRSQPVIVVVGAT
jgi:hypothetical protein